MKYILISIIVLLFSCNREPKNKINKTRSKSDDLKSKIIGRWGGLEEKTPVWDIRADSIYYFESSATYRYQIIHDDMIIELPESKGILRNIHVVGDTLFFLDEQGLLVRGYRFKN